MVGSDAECNDGGVVDTDAGSDADSDADSDTSSDDSVTYLKAKVAKACSKLAPHRRPSTKKQPPAAHHKLSDVSE